MNTVATKPGLAAPLRRLGTRGIRLLIVVGAIVTPPAKMAWRALGPVLRTITTAGWLVLVLAVGALTLSAVFGWQEFTYLGFILLASLALCAVFLFGRASYGVLVELNPRRVVVGDRAMGRIVVTNVGKHGLTPTRMELPVGQAIAEFQLPSMKPKDEHEELFAVPTNKRAVIIAGPAESVRGDQLGMLRRALKWADAVDLFVHPKTVRLASPSTRCVRTFRGMTVATCTGGPRRASGS